MSLRPQNIPPVPEETARIARAAFPKGNLYRQIRARNRYFVDRCRFLRFVSQSRESGLSSVAIGFDYHFPIY